MTKIRNSDPWRRELLARLVDRLKACPALILLSGSIIEFDCQSLLLPPSQDTVKELDKCARRKMQIYTAFCTHVIFSQFTSFFARFAKAGMECRASG
jgi:hypothetical protein